MLIPLLLLSLLSTIQNSDIFTSNYFVEKFEELSTETGESSYEILNKFQTEKKWFLVKNDITTGKPMSLMEYQKSNYTSKIHYKDSAEDSVTFVGAIGEKLYVSFNLDVLNYSVPFLFHYDDAQGEFVKDESGFRLCKYHQKTFKNQLVVFGENGTDGGNFIYKTCDAGCVETIKGFEEVFFPSTLKGKKSAYIHQFTPISDYADTNEELFFISKNEIMEKNEKVDCIFLQKIDIDFKVTEIVEMTLLNIWKNDTRPVPPKLDFDNAMLFMVEMTDGLYLLAVGGGTDDYGVIKKFPKTALGEKAEMNYDIFGEYFYFIIENTKAGETDESNVLYKTDMKKAKKVCSDVKDLMFGHTKSPLVVKEEDGIFAPELASPVVYVLPQEEENWSLRLLTVFENIIFLQKCDEMNNCQIDIIRPVDNKNVMEIMSAKAGTGSMNFLDVIFFGDKKFLSIFQYEETEKVQKYSKFELSYEGGCCPKCKYASTCDAGACVCIGNYSSPSTEIQDCSSCKEKYYFPEQGCSGYCDDKITCNEPLGKCGDNAECECLQFPSYVVGDHCVCEEGFAPASKCTMCLPKLTPVSDKKNVTKCIEISCKGKNSKEKDVCREHGTCILENYPRRAVPKYEGVCVCYEGWFSRGDCTDTMCNKILSNATKVCSGRGTCYAPDRCLCEKGAKGEFCGQMENVSTFLWILSIVFLGCVLPLVICFGLYLFMKYRRKKKPEEMRAPPQHFVKLDSESEGEEAMIDQQLIDREILEEQNATEEEEINVQIGKKKGEKNFKVTKYDDKEFDDKEFDDKDFALM